MPNPVRPSQAITIDNPVNLAELVRTCHGDGQPIVDYGLAHAGLGHPPPTRCVRLTQRGGVIEHDERDFVVRASAGTTMGDLQTVLSRARQFLPIDADDDLTLGEVILHNVYGPLRAGFGSARDLLLGLRYIDGLGRDIHVGGRTVKNVAGYDVTRFMVGSLGELGCVYEATVRTSAVPEAILAVQIRIDEPARVDHVMTDLLAGDAAPTHVSLHARQAATTVDLAYTGHPDGCQDQLRSLARLVESLSGFRIDHTAMHTLAEDDRHRADRRRWRRRAPALVKLLVPPANTGHVVQRITQLAENLAPVSIDALPADGCLFVGGQLDAQACAHLDEQIMAVVGPLGGLRAWYARPAGTESIQPFAPPQPDWPVLVRIKQTMDPSGLFNPGRFLPSEILAS